MSAALVGSRPYWNMQVECAEHVWQMSRSYSDFAAFDERLHACVFNRRFSMLPILGEARTVGEARRELEQYTQRLDTLLGNSAVASNVDCYPVLSFLQLDARGRRWVAAERTAAVNAPAIGAAIVTRAYRAAAPDQLTLNVGDIVSVVEMTAPAGGVANCLGKLTIAARPRCSPSADRALHEMTPAVGYFPAECIQLLGGGASAMQDGTRQEHSLPPQSSSSSSSTADAHLLHRLLEESVQRLRRLNRLLRAYTSRLATRKSSSAGGRSRIRVLPCFGIDLEVYLRATSEQVPHVVEWCTREVETRGQVTGIYRQCGVQSTVQKLKAAWNVGDMSRVEELASKDIYAVSSLLKCFFRHLQRSLIPRSLHDALLQAASADDEIVRATGVQQALRRLSSAHFRTARALFEHLANMLAIQHLTDMNAKNLAIVWTPNVFWNDLIMHHAASAVPDRSRRSPGPAELDKARAVDVAVLNGLHLYTSLCAYLIENARRLFDDTDSGVGASDVEGASSAADSLDRTKLAAALAATAQKAWPLRREVVALPARDELRRKSIHTELEVPAVFRIPSRPRKRPSWRDVFGSPNGAVAADPAATAAAPSNSTGNGDETDAQCSGRRPLRRTQNSGGRPAISEPLEVQTSASGTAAAAMGCSNVSRVVVPPSIVICAAPTRTNRHPFPAERDDAELHRQSAQKSQLAPPSCSSDERPTPSRSSSLFSVLSANLSAVLRRRVRRRTAETSNASVSEHRRNQSAPRMCPVSAGERARKPSLSSFAQSNGASEQTAQRRQKRTSSSKKSGGGGWSGRHGGGGGGGGARMQCSPSQASSFDSAAEESEDVDDEEEDDEQEEDDDDDDESLHMDVSCYDNCTTPGNVDDDDDDKATAATKRQSSSTKSYDHHHHRRRRGSLYEVSSRDDELLY